MIKRLYLSFWDICLDNLPQGRFDHRTVAASDASAMIRQACIDQTLRCVTQDDLLAPHKAKQLQRHKALCAVLRDRYSIPLGVGEFLMDVDDEDPPTRTIMALQFAHLEPGQRLMVVSCSYRFAGGSSDPDNRFPIAEDSVTFNLIEALSS